MRKNIKGLAFTVGAAVILVGASYASAALNPLNATEYDRREANHSDYGAGAWHTAVEGTAGDGDTSYGYVTGWTGEGTGIINTNFADGLAGGAEGLIAPQYTDPCPTEIFGAAYGGTGSGGSDMATGTLADCPGYTAFDKAQTNTAAFGAENDADAGILDDMLAKMFDIANPANSITQQLDILFVDNVTNDASLDDNSSTVNVIGARLFIDQTLDQDLAFYDGDITSYMTKGDGIKNRVTQLFELDNAAGKRGGGICNSTNNVSCGTEYGDDTRFDDSLVHDTHDADLMDQWVVGYTKDYDSGATPDAGIVSSISSWVIVENAAVSCGADCTYEYQSGHDTVNKTVKEIDQHPYGVEPVLVP